MTNHYIDFDALDAYLIQASNHYAKTAPQVETYLDDLILRLIDDHVDVTVYEILRVGTFLEDGEWLTPAGALNTVLHTLDILGKDTSGIME